MDILKNRWFLFTLRAVIGGLFIYAGIIKLINPQAFADSVATFRMLPAGGIGILAIALPPFELLVGFLMVAGWQLSPASFAISFLCLVFAVALAQALARGLLVDCGCFGSADSSNLKIWVSLGRDLLLLFGAMWLWVFCKACQH